MKKLILLLLILSNQTIAKETTLQERTDYAKNACESVFGKNYEFMQSCIDSQIEFSPKWR